MGGIIAIVIDRSRAALPILVVAVALIAAACGGGADGSGTAATPSASSNDTQVTTPAVSNESVSALDPAIIERSSSVDDAMTGDGGRLMVAVECDAQTGGDLLHTGAVGLPQGIYVGTVEPSVGGEVKFQVGPDGSGSGARQATLDDSAYTVTFADIDDGIELFVGGCSG